MPIDSVHPLYEKHIDQWVRCRDAFEGTDAIKGKTTTYLPRPTNMKQEQYRRRLDRALWYGATERAVQVLAGVISRKAPAVDMPDRMRVWLDDITFNGKPFETFADEVVREQTNPGRVGILTSMATEESVENRPYGVMYKAEDITMWHTRRVRGRVVLAMVVLRETNPEPSPDDPDGIALENVTQYRKLHFVPHGDIDADEYPMGAYAVTIYRKAGDDDDWVQGGTYVPTLAGKPFTEIPFDFVNAHNLTPRPEKPPLLDLVDVNLAHFKNSAIYETAIQVTGSPTPVGKMLDMEEKVVLGSESMVRISHPEGEFFFASYDGDGLGAIERCMEKKEKYMAAIASRALESQQLDAEAEATVRARRGGETAVSQAIAINGSMGLTSFLRRIVLWGGGSEEEVEKTRVALNTDLVDIRLSGADLTALTDAYFRGAISYATYYENLKRGEIARPGITWEEELEDIRNREEEALRNRPDASEREDEGGTGNTGGGVPTPEEEAEIEAELNRLEQEGGAV